jgi:hypothetical protein
MLRQAGTCARRNAGRELGGFCRPSVLTKEDEIVGSEAADPAAIRATRRIDLRHALVARGPAPWLRRVRWRRVVALAVGVVLAAYLAAATAAYVFIRYHRGVSAAQFADLALPSRWPHYRMIRGEHRLQEARRHADEGKFREALMFARAGLAEAPASREGRLLLADLLLAGQRPEFARQTLLDGLRFHAADAEFLQRVFTLLLQRQEDSEVIRLGRAHLALAPPGSNTEQVLALAVATANYVRGNYDAAERHVLQAPPLHCTRAGRLLLARIERDRGYSELAVVAFGQLAHDFPDDGEIHREWVAGLRRQGRVDDARRATLAFQIAHPADPPSRIALLVAYRDVGDMDRGATEVGSYLRDFANDRRALLRLAEFAAESGDSALVDRIRRRVEPRGLAADAYAFLAAEAQITAHQYREALAYIHRELDRSRQWSLEERGLFDSLRAIAYAGLHDDANSRQCLRSFFGQANLRAENLLAVANRLVAANALELARGVLLRAADVDPSNQPALARLIELDLELNRVDDLPPRLEQFLRMRRPSRDILRVARQKLGSDLFLFSTTAPAAVRLVDTALHAIEPHPAYARAGSRD